MSLLGKVLGGGIVGGGLDILRRGSSSGLGSIMPSPIPGGGIFRDPLSEYIVKKISETISELMFEEKTPKESSSVTKEDIENINKIIEVGRKQGLRELDIKISNSFADKLAASGTLPLEIPINVSASIDKNGDGEMIIKVKYSDFDPAEAVKKWHDLYKSGAISEEEYNKAKEKILNCM